MSTTSTTTPQFVTQTSRSAAGFIASLGVNTHVAYDNGAYANAAQVVTALNYLGIDHVRDTLYTTTLAENGFDTLAADGIKFDFTPTLQSNDSVSVSGFINQLTAYEKEFPGSISAIEGANEVNIWEIETNGTQSIANGAALQEAIYLAAKANATLSDIPVYNTTIGSTDPSLFAQLGNLSKYTDYANAHTYVMSTSNISTALSALVSLAESDAPGKPVVITEAGYSTLSSYWYDGVDQTTQARYTLDTLMDSYKQGISQTYLYELFDENLGTSYYGSYFGLFNGDGSPKFAAVAIHNLTTILGDPGASSSATPAGSLTYSLSGQPSTAQSMVLEKADGTKDLVLWAEPVAWNSTTQSEVITPASTVTVTFASTEVLVKVYNPLDGTTPIATYSNVDQIQVAVSDYPLIIEIAPDLSDTKQYNSAGVLTSETIVHTDGSKDVYLYDIQNQDYVSEHDTYGSSGVLTAQIRSHQDGSLASSYSLATDGTRTSDSYDAAGVLKSSTIVHVDHSYDIYTYGILNQSYSSEHDTYSASGALTSESLFYPSGSLDMSLTVATNGTRTTDNYNTSGALTSLSVANSDGSSESKSYTNGVLTGETIKYAAGSANQSETMTYTTSGVLTHDSIVHADGSRDVYDSNVTGKTYTADHFVYNTAGQLLSGDVTNLDGSHTQSAYAAGVTLSSTAGVADTLTGYSAGNDTFNFAAGFGHDTVTGFLASGTNHDTLAIDSSEAANFQQLQMQTVGHDTLITLSANDSILIKGVLATSLTAADFHFVPHVDLIA